MEKSNNLERLYKSAELQSVWFGKLLFPLVYKYTQIHSVFFHGLAIPMEDCLEFILNYKVSITYVDKGDLVYKEFISLFPFYLIMCMHSS